MNLLLPPRLDVPPVGTLFPLASKEWASRLKVDGQWYVLKLGFARARAVELDVEARQRVRVGYPVASAQFMIDRELGRELQWLVPTFGETVRAKARSRLDLNPTVADNDSMMFLRDGDIVLEDRATAPWPERPSRRLTLNDYRVASQSVTLLDAAFAADLMRIFLQGLAPKDEARVRRSLVQHFCRIRQVLFGPSAFYKLEGIRMPDFTPFLKASFIYAPGKDKPVHCSKHIGLVFDYLEWLDRSPEQKLFFILALCLLAGLRANEIADLHRGQMVDGDIPGISLVDFADHEQKDGHPRFVPLPRWLFDRLMAWFGRSANGYLLPGLPHARLAETQLANASLRDNVDVPEIRLHRCRGYFAAFLMADGKTANEIIEIMGHYDIETTLEYYADEALEPEDAKRFRCVLSATGPAGMVPMIVAA